MKLLLTTLALLAVCGLRSRRTPRVRRHRRTWAGKARRPDRQRSRIQIRGGAALLSHASWPKRHGSTCTVLFGVDAKTGEIVPGNSNIPGTEALKTADLLVHLHALSKPAAQMQPIVDYLNRGAAPSPGLRTATHAFRIPCGQPLCQSMTSATRAQISAAGLADRFSARRGWAAPGRITSPAPAWTSAPAAPSHPILQVAYKDVWAEIGAYNAYPIAGSEVLAMAQPLSGMSAANRPPTKPRSRWLGAWVRRLQ